MASSVVASAAAPAKMGIEPDPASVAELPPAPIEPTEGGTLTVSSPPVDGMSRVSPAAGDGATFASATDGPRPAGSRSSVGAIAAASIAVVGGDESTATVSLAEPSGGMKGVSSARGSCASLIGRLRSGSLASATTAASWYRQSIRSG